MIMKEGWFLSMFKIVFCDIDGTLLNSQHKVANETKKSILALKSKGIPFILVSARMPSAIIPIQQSLSIHYPIICYSGALIIDAPDRKADRPILHHSSIPNSIVNNIYKQVCQTNGAITISLFSFDQWIVEDRKNEWVKQEEEIVGVTPNTRVISELIKKNSTVHKILCMGEPHSIEKLERILKKELDGLNIYKSKNTYLEIMNENASKANAMSKLIQKYKIKQKDTVAIGDHFNDVDMIQYAGLGVAMGNAPEQVKDMADELTMTNDQNGVMAVLEKYFN